MLFITMGRCERAERFIQLDAGSDCSASLTAHLARAHGDEAAARAAYERVSGDYYWDFYGDVFARCHERTPEARAVRLGGVEPTLAVDDPEAWYWAAG